MSGAAMLLTGLAVSGTSVFAATGAALVVHGAVRNAVVVPIVSIGAPITAIEVVVRSHAVCVDVTPIAAREGAPVSTVAVVILSR